jgi:hypothetical protein
MIVEWTESALDRLADLFVSADLAEQDLIEAAVKRINAALAADPWDLGESRSSGWRVWFVDPLMVIFRVSQAGGRVIVSHVARPRRK